MLLPFAFKTSMSMSPGCFANGYKAEGGGGGGGMQTTNHTTPRCTRSAVWGHSDFLPCLAGATLVYGFTIGGNSLGSTSWQGEAVWYTGYGAQSKGEQLDCGARFKPDINGYLGASGSRFKTIQVILSSSGQVFILHLLP